MKIEIKIDREEAERILSAAVLKEFFGQRDGLRVSECEWNTYRTSIEMTITDEPEIIPPSPVSEEAA